jgi:hypothetical protein
LTIEVSVLLTLFFFLFSEGRPQTLLNQFNQMLDKAVNPKLDTSIFCCLQGYFPKISEEESPPLLRAKGREALILNYLGKGRERLRIGGKESFQDQHMRDYWSPLLPRLILTEAVLENWKQGVTSTLRPQEL